MLMGRNDPQDYFSHFEWDNSTYQAIADVGNTIIGTCMQFTGISTQWHRGGMEKAGKMSLASTGLSEFESSRRRGIIYTKSE